MPFYASSKDTQGHYCAGGSGLLSISLTHTHTQHTHTPHTHTHTHTHTQKKVHILSIVCTAEKSRPYGVHTDMLGRLTE